MERLCNKQTWYLHLINTCWVNLMCSFFVFIQSIYISNIWYLYSVEQALANVQCNVYNLIRTCFRIGKIPFTLFSSHSLIRFNLTGPRYKAGLRTRIRIRIWIQNLEKFGSGSGFWKSSTTDSVLVLPTRYPSRIELF